MAQLSESIKKDRQNRVLAEKFYNDKSFSFQNATGLSKTTTSTSYTLVDNSELTEVFEKDTTVLVLFFGILQTSLGLYIGSASVYLDNVSQFEVEVSASDTFGAEVLSYHTVMELDAGSHTFDIRVKTSNATDDVILQQGSLSYIHLVEK